DFILLLMRALELEGSVETNFTDVDAFAYYAEAVGVAKALGITNGDGTGKFNPGSFITRQEMMTLVDRAMEVSGTKLPAGSSEDLNSFADSASIASYAQASVAALVKSGIV